MLRLEHAHDCSAGALIFSHSAISASCAPVSASNAWTESAGVLSRSSEMGALGMVASADMTILIEFRLRRCHAGPCTGTIG